MIKNYLHIALRNLQHNKSYLVINVLGLGLGLASAIIIFSVISFHLSFDNFHKDSDRIYRIVTEMHRDNIAYTKNVPAPLGKAIREDYDFDEDIARVVTLNQPLINIKRNDQVHRFRESNGLAFAEEGYFYIFNYPLKRGNIRTALSEPNTAVITDEIAARYFGADDPVGKRFTLDNKTEITITGVLKDIPKNTDSKAEVYVSYATIILHDKNLARDDAWGGIRDVMQCYIKLKPAVTVAQVESVLPAYVKKFRPNSKNVHHYKLQRISDVHFNASYGGMMAKKNLWILAVIGIFLIITACVNFINLATAQALKRSKEIGVRKVLGGMKGQIFRQFILETVAITVIAMITALCLTILALPVVNKLFQTAISPQFFQDWRFPFFIIGLTMLIAFLAGSYPGLVLARFRPVHALKGKISQQNIGGFNTRRSLVVTQFAISLMLIIGMVVIISQIRYTKETNLGFTKDAVVLLPLGADSTGLKQEALKTELLKLPGVENVSVCMAAPASDNTWNNSIRFDGSSEEVNFRTSVKLVDDQYIPTFDIQLIAGRNLLPSDTVREFVVNETFMKNVGYQDPKEILGKMIAADGGQMNGQIVGVVKDFHDRSFHEEISPVILASEKADYEIYAVKFNLAQTKNILPLLERMWLKNYPDQVYEYQFLDESIAKFYTAEEQILKMIQWFSMIAILISCLGLFGLMKFMAAQKTKEIGIRKLLGSSLSGIIWLFGKEFSRLIVIAFLIAAPLSWYIMNSWLQDFQYRINIGVSIFAIAISGTFLIAFITVCYQAIKASLANPVKSLRAE